MTSARLTVLARVQPLPSSLELLCATLVQFGDVRQPADLLTSAGERRLYPFSSSMVSSDRTGAQGLPVLAPERVRLGKYRSLSRILPH